MPPGANLSSALAALLRDSFRKSFMSALMLLCPLLAPSPAALPQDPRIVVDGDDTIVESSCTLVFEAAVEDRDGSLPGVVRIVAPDVTVTCEGTLNGANGQPPDAYRGVGIVVAAEGVTLRDARVAGFRVGIQAERADGLVIEDADVSDNFRQRLGSTPEREDPSDWLWPHDNDAGEWIERYGAGIHVARSKRVTVRGSRARDVQNGLILDRVVESLVYDNDFSFLSGWGVALWRSNRNFVTRNALDFCVRGYSHGVYNRGQDSAGLLLFEQCSGNVVAENSITHGGDGIFAFAGKEALGEREGASDLSFERRGNNDNWFVRNDLSYAAAHGLELTFSFGNSIVGNRLIENAICGIWGGYSRETIVAENLFVGNGEGAYGNERGGVNVEHGQGWVLLRNRFEGNRCGVAFWWDEDPHLAELPWTKANGFGSGDHALFENDFVRDVVALELRDAGPVTLHGNRLQDVETERTVEGASSVQELSTSLSWQAPELPMFGTSEPIGARERLIGRARIVMTEWGPYDWSEPFLWLRSNAGGVHGYRALLGTIESMEVSAGAVVERSGDTWNVRSASPGVVPYSLVATIDGTTHRTEGLLVAPRWDARFFAWETDPREDVEAWRAEAQGPGSRSFDLGELDLPFGAGGPGDLLEGVDAEFTVGDDRFGCLATTELHFPAGSFVLRTASDDGVRLWIDDALVIDDWTHHATRTHEATLRLEEARTVRLRLEYFELDGAATLSCDVARAPDEAAPGRSSEQPAQGR